MTPKRTYSWIIGIRKKLKTEPWGSPKVNKAKSSALAAKMKAALIHS